MNKTIKHYQAQKGAIGVIRKYVNLHSTTPLTTMVVYELYILGPGCKQCDSGNCLHSEDSG